MTIKKALEESSETMRKTSDLSKEIEDFIDIIVNCYKSKNKVLICGNGGSAAQAQHIAAEFVGRYKKERKGMPFIALTTDTSIVTAWSNDYSFDTLFQREVEALGTENDVLVGLSTSGNSENVIKAIKKAKQMGMKTVALLGKDGGKTKGLADVEIIIPSDNTPRIQEAHIAVLHIMCEQVEERLFK